MNAVILNGAPAGDRGAVSRKVREAMVEELRSRGWTVKIFDLESLNIKPCRGCFACWLKHPGTCAIKDDEEEILRALAADDLSVWISPVTFGGASSTLKKALDRMIPTLLPFFIKVRGEVHHPQRYDKRRRLIAVGTLDAPDPEAEKTFRGLAARTGLNMQAPGTAAGFVYNNSSDRDIAARVRELAQAAGIA